jgi:hypothetical protein
MHYCRIVAPLAREDGFGQADLCQGVVFVIVLLMALAASASRATCARTSSAPQQTSNAIAFDRHHSQFRRRADRWRPRGRSLRTRCSLHEGKSSAGETVLSIPEDTSLYYLSGTICPTRLFSFTLGRPGTRQDDGRRNPGNRKTSAALSFVVEPDVPGFWDARLWRRF